MNDKTESAQACVTISHLLDLLVSSADEWERKCGANLEIRTSRPSDGLSVLVIIRPLRTDFWSLKVRATIQKESRDLIRVEVVQQVTGHPPKNTHRSDPFSPDIARCRGVAMTSGGDLGLAWEAIGQAHRLGKTVLVELPEGAIVDFPEGGVKHVGPTGLVDA